MCTQLENIFWRTLNINSDILWITWNLSNHRFSLQVLIKWKLTKLWGILVSVHNFLMEIFLVVNEESNECYFNLLAFWFVVEGGYFFHLTMFMDHVFFFFLHDVDVGVRDQALFDDLL